MPTADDFTSYYPAMAQHDQVAGRATINCTITAELTLAACTVVSETPEGYGFGEAALRLATLFKMKPRNADGAATAGGTVTIPIRFQLPKPDPQMDPGSKRPDEPAAPNP